MKYMRELKNQHSAESFGFCYCVGGVDTVRSWCYFQAVKKIKELVKSVIRSHKSFSPNQVCTPLCL